MDGLDCLGALPVAMHLPTGVLAAPPPVATRPVPIAAAPPRPSPRPATPVPVAAQPSPRVTASAEKAQAAANRAIAAGQKLSRHNKAAGQRLIATGNAHAARAQAMLKGSVAAQRGSRVIGVVQGPDPGVVDPQSDAVNAVAQLGEQSNQLLDWVTALQTSGPKAALQQVIQSERG